MIDKTKYMLNGLKELYALPNMPKNIYSADYIIKTLFKPEERSKKLLIKIKKIINKKN